MNRNSLRHSRPEKQNVDPVSNTLSHEAKLVAAMEEFCEAMEQGRGLDRQAFLNQHQEIARELEECLNGMDWLHDGAVEAAKSVSANEHGQVDFGQPPALLGDFRIVRELGRGGMGVVYEAIQAPLDRRVALKLLPFAAIADERQLTRFKNEARAAGTLHHPHIVPVHAVGLDKGVHYYAMQFVDGPSLAEVIRGLQAETRPELELASETASNATHPTPPSSDTQREIQAAVSTVRSTSKHEFFRDAAKWISQAADGLAHAHENGVLHRDIKPGNLLLDRSRAVWITDFGLARLESDASMTATGDLLGTLRYMAPEQALGKRVLIDHRADVYSLGITLYELLALRPAFEGSNREELLRHIADHEPVPLRSIDAKIPDDLETIVLKATAKQPEERYESAGEMAEDLRRFADRRPIHAQRPGLLVRARRWANKHRRIVATSSAISFVALLALGYAQTRFTNQLQAKNEQLLAAEATSLESLDIAMNAVGTFYETFRTEVPESISATRWRARSLLCGNRTNRSIAHRAAAR